MKTREEVKILVVGDIMLDKYIVGDVKRISPEAPVPIINVTHDYHTLGGCGNVVRNIAELGCRVDCIASVGVDIEAEIIQDELEKVGAIPKLIRDSRVTTVKERYIADHRKIQMLRVDREYIREVDSRRLIDHYKRTCKNDYDIIVVSDYAKGVISYEFLNYLKHAQHAPLIVDPKPSHITYYDDVFMITPNEKEWLEMEISSKTSLRNVEYLLVTRGQHGMALIDNNSQDEKVIPADIVEVYNVSGAGDVVIAIMAVCLACGMSVLDSANISNKCAGYTVTQPQTCVVPENIFKRICYNYFGINF
jgi:rfaE bifunctional protein kinase chain/domain